VVSSVAASSVSSVTSSVSSVTASSVPSVAASSHYDGESEPEPEVENNTSSHDVKTYIINMNNEEGHRRRMMRGDLKPNEEYVTPCSYDDIPEIIKNSFFGRHKGVTRESSISCLWSHMRLWLEIGESGVGCLILEDDAMKVRSMTEQEVQEMVSQEAVMLLGGAIRTKGAWDAEREDYIESLNYQENAKSWKLGVNMLNGHKITGTLAYYMPAIQARVMTAYISICLDSGKKLKVADVFLNSSPCVVKFRFPNVYAEGPGCSSQCGSPYKDLGADCYLTREMQNMDLNFYYSLLASYPRAVQNFSIGTPPETPRETDNDVDLLLPCSSSVNPLHVYFSVCYFMCFGCAFHSCCCYFGWLLMEGCPQLQHQRRLNRN